MNCNKPILVTNDRAAEIGFRVKRGASFSQSFRFKKQDGTYLSLTGLLPVMVVYSVGNEITRYEIGNGFSIDPTDDTVLIMEKQADEKNVIAGMFTHEMLMPFTAEDQAFMWQGWYTSVETLIPL